MITSGFLEILVPNSNFQVGEKARFVPRCGRPWIPACVSRYDQSNWADK